MSISFLFMLTSRGRILLSKLILKIPKIGELIIKIFMWQFCKIMHIALDAKLNFVQSLNLAIETIKFSYLKSELESIRNNILEGYKVAESFFNSTVIPKEIITSICVGEEGNDLSSSFGHVSEDLYKEILFGIKSFGQIMSIGLTVFTGLIFIFILCSLFYPIYNYVEIAGA
jgi:type IV pilus assembly protein PilC